MPKLEKWSVGAHPRDAWQPPENQPPCLHGWLTGHPGHADGNEVTTSPIVGVEGELVITESGTRYELGEVDPVYEALFPGARARLFESYK